MAGLNGAIYSYKLPNSDIGYSVSAERLYHTNGMRRELFRNIRPVPQSYPGFDGTLAAALTYLRSKAR